MKTTEKKNRSLSLKRNVADEEYNDEEPWWLQWYGEPEFADKEVQEIHQDVGQSEEPTKQKV